jgi:retinol-binding protein 3
LITFRTGIVNLAVKALAQSNQPDITIDAAERALVIDGTIKNLKEFYVFPDAAQTMAGALRALQKRGDYDSVTSGTKFAELLTKNLQDVSHDKHLRVIYSSQAIPNAQPGWPPMFSPPPDENTLHWMKSVNCLFEKVQILPGNIGYLYFHAFMDTQYCGDTAAAAMSFLGNSDALIVDLRENGGGDPAMIALIASYLFDQPTHLIDFWERKGGTTQQWWTSPYVPGKRPGQRVPVYVLTSSDTFSGAEEFAYDLRNLKRATIIGEVTGGGAHPGTGLRLDEHFLIGVPWARPINPISKTDWEGVGVEPDVKVKREIALETAEKAALEKLASTVSDPRQKNAIAKELDRVNRALQPGAQ